MRMRKTNLMIVGCSYTSADMEYATKFRTFDPIVFLQAWDRRHVVVPDLEVGRARSNLAQAHVHSPSSLGLNRAARRRLDAWALALLRKLKVTRISVPASFPLGVARRLERNGIKVALCAEPVFPERAVKSAEEVRNIAETQQASVIAMRRAVAMIAAAEPDRENFLRTRGGCLTSELVRGAIQETLLVHGCLGREIIVACGVHAADPHDTGHGPLRAREPIVMDIFPQHLGHGYWGDLTRTVSWGNPAPEVRRMYAAVREAQAAALRFLKPGLKCGTIHAAAAEVFEHRGFETRMENGRRVGFTHGTGHGVGLSIHERPSLGYSEERLRSGHVVTIEPGLYYPELGGVRIEDTVVLVPGGWRYLAPCEKKLVVGQ